MIFYLVEDERLLKMLYGSCFPRYRKTRGEETIVVKHTRQSLFRKTLTLYVDDIATYRELGGLRGKRVIERYRASDYPSFGSVSGINTYDFPAFHREETPQGGLYPERQIIKSIDRCEEDFTIHSEELKQADSPEGLNEICSVYFDYIKSWNIKSDIKEALSDERWTMNWFKSQLKRNSITTIEQAESLIAETMLEVDPRDSGIVRLSKAADFSKLQHLAQQMLSGNSIDGTSFFDTQTLHSCLDPYVAELRLYGPSPAKKDYYSMAAAYKDLVLKSLAPLLRKLAGEAEYLSLGITRNTVDVNWAKMRLKELQDEWNESAFDMKSNIETRTALTRFNNAVAVINNR